MPIQPKENKRKRAVEEAVQQEKGGRNRVLKDVIGRNNSYSQRGCGGQWQALRLFESLAAGQAKSLWQVLAKNSKKKAELAGKAQVEHW